MSSGFPVVAALLAALFAAVLTGAPAGATDHRAVRIQAAENGDVVLHVTGIGRPPGRSSSAAQAAAAAHNAAEIDAYARVAYLLGRVARRQGRDEFVASFRERFTGIHVERSVQLEDGTVRAEVTITVPARQVPDLLERIDDYIGELDAESGRPRRAPP